MNSFWNDLKYQIYSSDCNLAKDFYESANQLKKEDDLKTTIPQKTFCFLHINGHLF